MTFLCGDPEKGVLPYISGRWVPQSLLLKPLRV